MDKIILHMRLTLLFAVVLLLCACSGSQGRQQASPTPYIMPYTAQPTEIALPEDGIMAVPSLEQMKAQIKKGTPWYLRVDACNQLIGVYALDQSKNYTYLVNRFICSTPKGLSPMLLQTGGSCPLVKSQWERDGDLKGYYSEFSMEIGGVLSLRSVPVLDQDAGIPDCDIFNGLALPTDRPYVVLLPDDARWLYDHLTEGAFLEVVYDSPVPDLTQSLAPMPCIEGCPVDAGKQDFAICIVEEPHIVWGSLDQAMNQGQGQ